MATPNFPRSGGPQFLRRTFLPLTVAVALAPGLTGCRPSDEEIRSVVRTEMENAWKLTVPLVVETGAGRNWGEAH